MRVTCPSCHAQMSLDVFVSHEAARAAMARLAAVSLPFGALALRYIGLFRPEQRGLSIERMVKLLEELLPDIERRAIARKGRDWDAAHETWRAGFELVLAKRDKGTLTLPLTSHGLLYEVMAGMAEKAEAEREREREAERRTHRPAGIDRGPRHLADVAQAIGVDSLAVPAAAPTAPAAPPPSPTGPSRAAQALQAQIEAHQQRRAAGSNEAPTPQQPETTP